MRRHRGSRTRQQAARELDRLLNSVSTADQPRAREAVRKRAELRLGKWFGLPRLDRRYDRSTHERIRDEDLLSDEPLLEINGRRVSARKWRITEPRYTPEFLAQEHERYTKLRAVAAEARAARARR